MCRLDRLSVFVDSRTHSFNLTNGILTWKGSGVKSVYSNYCGIIDNEFVTI